MKQALNSLRRLFDKLYRFVLARVDGKHELAEDIVQTSLCKAIDKLDSYRGEAALLTWLCTFCRFELSAYFRQHKKQPLLIDDQPELKAQLESFAIALQQEPENQMLKSELNKLVHLTLDNLPERYAKVVELKYIQGYSVKEIALFIDCTPKAVESLLSRARPLFEELFCTISGHQSANSSISGGR